MSRYSQRVEALENNEKKKRRIFTVIIVVLVLLFLGGMVLGAQRVLGTEGTFDPYAETTDKPIPVDGSPQELLDALSASLGSADNPKSVKLSVYTDIDIPDDSISVASGNEKLVTELKYIKHDVLEAVKGYYEVYEGSFGEDFSDKALPVTFSADDIASIQCGRGKIGDDEKLTDLDSLFYTVEFPEVPFDFVEDSVIFKSFGMDVSESIRDTFISDISAIAEVNSVDISCSGFKINAEAEKETGKIENIAYVRSYSVKLSLSFKGELSDLGKQQICFTFNATESHWYNHAGLRLSDSTLSLEKGDIHAFEAFRTADEDVELTWVSSAPEIAEVDDKGYVKGNSESTQPVTITASFEYLGITYTDSCTVYVRNPVSEIKVSQKELTLSVGENASLEVSVKPKKATIKDILWFSEDESVAQVDSDGNITAVGVGETKVFAISADGYYRSSCVVTVTQ